MLSNKLRILIRLSNIIILIATAYRIKVPQVIRMIPKELKECLNLNNKSSRSYTNNLNSQYKTRDMVHQQ